MGFLIKFLLLGFLAMVAMLGVLTLPGPALALIALAGAVGGLIQAASKR